MISPMPSEQIVSCLQFWARRWPERLALVCGAQRWSWGELDRRTDEIAAGLAREGVGKGDSVGILMRNRLEYVEAMLGAFKAGAAVVLLNVRYTAAEMLHPLTDACIRLVIADERFLPVLDKAAETAKGFSLFTTDAVAGRQSLDDLRIAGAKAPAVSLSGEDIALICYTSGTTGTPKGAMLSHLSIYSGSAAKSFVMALTYDDRVLGPMPLCYTGGAIMMLRDGIIPGATYYITADASADDMLRLIETERISVTASVTLMFENMMNHPRFAEADISSLRNAATGGQAVTLHLLRTWQARGVQLTQGYGLTESAGTFVTLLFPDEAERKIGSAGKPLPHIELKIVNESGETLGVNEPGEILMRGPAVMSGYLNLPEQTAAAFEGGWLHTGDVGALDEDGYLRILDRSKDMLISGGLNVYPAEIEKALADIPGLEELAVIGVKDERWGEAAMIVVAALERVDLDALRARCLSDLADYKRPKYIVGHGEELPRTYSGKITKAPLRTLYPVAPEKAVLLKK